MTVTALASIQPIHIAPVGNLWSNTDCTYAGIMRAGDIRYHLLVSSRETDKAGLKWGPYGKNIKGADSTWDGLANTRALLASGLESPAAQCAVSEGGIADDGWYLPSQRELALCWATVPEIFETDDWYWSSTQSSALNAWMQGFSNGTQHIDSKASPGRVRLVRRLIIR